VDKLRFLEAAARRIAELSGGPLVVGGDFNVCPTDLDVYDPAAFVGSTHVTPAERERFAALLDAGVVDAFRELHPDEPGFTWWDYRQGHFHRKMGLRIDALLLSPRLAERLESCGIDRNYRKGPKPSDHAPLLAELRD
jgi:exodeoxyribonuclease III